MAIVSDLNIVLRGHAVFVIVLGPGAFGPDSLAFLKTPPVSHDSIDALEVEHKYTSKFVQYIYH